MSGQLPKWVDLGVIPLLNVTAAFIVSGLVVLFIGENPIQAVKEMLFGSLGYGEGIGFTIYYTTNFIFTGLAVAVAFHSGLFNIGGEGQAYIAGLGVALVCLTFGASFPWWINFPLAIIGAGLFGAAWALIPAWLQARRGSHIVITTIMFNLIAASVMVYLLVNVLKVPGSMEPATARFAEGGTLPLLNTLVPAFGYSPANISIFWALICCIFVYILIWRTRLGYEMRTFGFSQTAAVYAGISPTKIIVVTMVISGALAGMMALNEVMGAAQRLQDNFTAGYGFVGIAVALMGRSHPFGIILASVLFGVLYQGGAELAFAMPAITRDMIVVIQGLVILFAGALEHMFRPSLIKLFAGRSPEPAPAQ